MNEHFKQYFLQLKRFFVFLFCLNKKCTKQNKLTSFLIALGFVALVCFELKRF